jgi:hypothetical protein
MFSKPKPDSLRDVAAIVTAMTDAEQPFVSDTLNSVLSDPGIAQVILCIEENNTWIDTTIGAFATDPRLKIVRLPLKPLGAVRNHALSYVQVPWVAYCDGDDMWCKGKTLIQRGHADRTGCDFVGADHYLTNHDGKIRAFAPARYLPMPSSWMVRTEVMKQHPFTEQPFSLSQEESGEWWIRTSGIVSKTRCPRMLLRYRIRSNSLSSKTPSMQRKAKVVALANIPGLGAIIFFLTGCLWLSTRQNQYVWLEKWGEQPAIDTVRRVENVPN